jgi:hypothetical protein
MQFIRWFRDNFIILAIIILFLWFIAIWMAFSKGLLTNVIFESYAMYGTALGTALLALATLIMARNNSRLTELTRLSLEKPLIGEIIVDAIEPVERRMESDAEAMEAEGICLYDIPLPDVRADLLPRTLYDIKTLFLGDIFAHYPHYKELARRYPEFGNYLDDFARNVGKAQDLIEQTLREIEICLRAHSFGRAISGFPNDSKIPLKYLPVWELLAASGRTVPRLGYDRYHLWSSEVDSFWQKYKEEVMAAIDSTKAPTLIVDANRILKECEDTLVRKAKRLNAVKEELKVKYLFTEEELQLLRERRAHGIYWY